MPKLTAPRPNPWIGKDKRFQFQIFVAKAYEASGQWYIDAIATGPQIDLQRERMGQKALDSMNARFNAGDLPLVKTHFDSEWLDEFGYVQKGVVVPDGDIAVTVWLDKEMEWSQILWRKLNGVPPHIAPRQLGVSIGGYLKLAHDELLPDGERICVIDDIELVHLAMTSQPAYERSLVTGHAEKGNTRFTRRWVHQIAKAWDWKRQGGSTENTADSRSGSSPGRIPFGVGLVTMELRDEEEERLVRTYLNGGLEMPDKKMLKGEDPGQGDEDLSDELNEETETEKSTDQGSGGGDQSGESETPWATGSWKTVSEVTAEDRVWCDGTGQAAPPPPAKSRKLEVSKSKASEVSLLVKQARRIKQLKAQVNELLTLTDDEDEDDEPQLLRRSRVPARPAPRGFRSSAGTDEKSIRQRQQPSKQAVNTIEELKSTEAYKKATPAVRQKMLIDAIRADN